MKKSIIILLVTVSFLTNAQNISGIVKSSDGAVIVNALVSETSNPINFAKTGSDGKFTIKGTNNSKISVFAHKFQSKRNQSITNTSNIVITLEPKSSSANIIYDNDVDFVRPGLYTKPECLKDFQSYYANGFKKEGSTKETTDRVTIDNQNSTNIEGKSIKIMYPKGEVDSKPSGAQWQTDLGGEFTELYLAYKVKFDPNFDFTLGGKLPGLAGSVNYGGSEKEWSGKLMWRENGKAEFYMHVSGTNQKSFDWILNGKHTQFKRGIWHSIEIHYKLNTPGVNDGLMEAWLDGELVGQYKNIGIFRIAGENDVFINNLFFSTFFGGNETYAPKKDEYSWFDDFIVSKSRINTTNTLNSNSYLSSTNNIVIAPNPSNNGVFRIYSEINGKLKISVNDILGKQVYSTTLQDELQNGSFEMNMSNYSKGVYLMQIESDSFVETKKIIIQ